MRIAVTGAQGQLGRALLAELGERYKVIPLDHTGYDISNPAIIEQIMVLHPDLIINTAAYTNVDGCGADARCFAVNVQGVQHLALAASACAAELLHISTNEVFGGDRLEPYGESDTPHPVNAYGASKLQGEQIAHEYTSRLYIVRTAWLYNTGGSNFITKIIAAARRQGALRVVDDEYGNPTYACDVAHAIAQLIETHRYGIYHLVNAGFCSRHAYACQILRLAGLEQVQVTPITSAEWVRASRPPARAVLVNRAAAELGIVLRPWQEALAGYFRWVA